MSHGRRRQRVREKQARKAAAVSVRALGRCGANGKKQFATGLDAELVIEEARRHEGKRPVRAYQCPHCGCWHVTSQAQRAA